MTEDFRVDKEKFKKAWATTPDEDCTRQLVIVFEEIPLLACYLDALSKKLWGETSNTEKNAFELINTLIANGQIIVDFGFTGKGFLEFEKSLKQAKVI